MTKSKNEKSSILNFKTEIIQTDTGTDKVITEERRRYQYFS